MGEEGGAPLPEGAGSAGYCFRVTCGVNPLRVCLQPATRHVRRCAPLRSGLPLPGEEILLSPEISWMFFSVSWSLAFPMPALNAPRMGVL